MTYELSTRRLTDCNKIWQCMLLQVLFLPFLLSFLTGCSSITKAFTPEPTIGQKVSYVANEVSVASTGLGMLNYIGAICTLIGVGVLVITKGTMGMRAILIGIGLCLLNFFVATYADWILIPMLVASGLISLAWGYVTIREMLDKE